MSVNSNQVKFTPVVPSDPPQNIPVTQTDPTLLMPGIWLWSGSAWVKALCDASGHFQVDILSIPAAQIYPKRPANSTQIAKWGQANGSTIVVHTVTIGKTFYLSHYSHSFFPIAAGSGEIYVANASDITQYYIMSCHRLIGDGYALSGTFNPPLEISAGWKISVTSDTASALSNLFVAGWEE